MRQPLYMRLQHILNSLNACSRLYRYLPRTTARRLIIVYETVVHPLIYKEMSLKTRKE